jgi:hypothetical protein
MAGHGSPDTQGKRHTGGMVTKRKRIPPPRRSLPRPQATYETKKVQPDGVMWPAGGFEADQYSPAGEVVVFANLFRGLQQRWRRRHLGSGGDT